MEQQQTQHEEILKAVGELSKKTGELSDKTDEILEAVGHFSNKTQERLDALDKDMAGVKSEVASIKSQMVTKDYLDEKFSDFKGDLTVLMRKEDRKLVTLVSILETRKVINQEDANKVLELEPFPQRR